LLLWPLPPRPPPPRRRPVTPLACVWRTLAVRVSGPPYQREEREMKVWEAVRVLWEGTDWGVCEGQGP
jgi:hypothetical protein